MQYLVEIHTHYRYKDGDGKTRGKVTKLRIPAMHFDDAKDIAGKMKTADWNEDIQRDCFVVVKLNTHVGMFYVHVEDLKSVTEDITEMYRCYRVDADHPDAPIKSKLARRKVTVPVGWQSVDTSTEDDDGPKAA